MIARHTGTEKCLFASLDEVTSLTCAGRDLYRIGRHKIYATPFEQYEKEIRDQLQAMLGKHGFNHETDIRAITVNRIPLGYAYFYLGLDDPEWKEGEAPHEVGRAQFGRISIANSDSETRPYMDAAFDAAGRSVSTGIWTAEPGILKVRSYPGDEVFTVLSGEIEVTNEDGSVVHVGPGQSCLLRKGWTGLFHTFEQTRKCFVTAKD